MADDADPLVLDFVEWIAREPRSYSEVAAPADLLAQRIRHITFAQINSPRRKPPAIDFAGPMRWTSCNRIQFAVPAGTRNQDRNAP
jgi:hypothetical protein